MSRYVKMCEEVAKLILAAGFIVYVSRNGEHGFFTDESGRFVVSFGSFGYVPRFSGNYIGSGVGQGCGWGIEDIYPLTEEKVRQISIAACCPPVWATGGRPVTLHTAESYLRVYGSSSGFHLFNGVDYESTC